MGAHLDIKPENILLDSEDNVQLCDFGGSFNWKRNDMNYNLSGTEFYMAPEVDFHEYGYSSIQADIWSLGIVLYFMLTGDFPYDGASEEEKNCKLFSNKSLNESTHGSSPWRSPYS